MNGIDCTIQPEDTGLFTQAQDKLDKLFPVYFENDEIVDTDQKNVLALEVTRAYYRGTLHHFNAQNIVD